MNITRGTGSRDRGANRTGVGALARPGNRNRLKRGSRTRREEGASLVEMAMVAPFLILLLLGIVEFGWLLGQFNDVRHGAREGARYAAVDGGSTGDIVGHVCTAMDGLTAGMSDIQVNLSGAGGKTGESGRITVEAEVTGLSNAPIISSLLPATLTSTVEFRLEQPAGWSNGGGGC